MSKFSVRDLASRRAVAISVIEPVLKAKRDRSIVSIYDRIQPGTDGRSHTVLSPVGTSTSRLSSAETLLFPESSTNWQNIPNKVTALDPLYKVRDCVIADEGMELVAGDYAGAEAVLAAAYSRDWPFLAKLLSSADVHSEHAQHFFDISPEDWNARGGKDNPELKKFRNVAKNVTYASFYMATAPTVARTINRDSHITGVRVTESEVAQARAVLLQLHPLERWWEETRQELERDGGITWNCFGYRRVFRDIDPDERLKAALSNYPQSTVACLMNKTLVDLEATPFPGELLLQVHDELFFQCRPQDKRNLIQTVTPLMTRRFAVHGHELYVPVEWKSGPRWGSMKKLELETM